MAHYDYHGMLIIRIDIPATKVAINFNHEVFYKNPDFKKVQTQHAVKPITSGAEKRHAIDLEHWYIDYPFLIWNGSNSNSPNNINTELQVPTNISENGSFIANENSEKLTLNFIKNIYESTNSINIKNQHFKIAVYTDDLTISFQDNWLKFIMITRIYKAVLNAKVNKSKTVLILITIVAQDYEKDFKKLANNEPISILRYKVDGRGNPIKHL
ncbi:21407_t:CDS:2 [Gigaspora rosea]|nr:21407_t:CDS:2 [Gigaspora rosea]